MFPMMNIQSDFKPVKQITTLQSGYRMSSYVYNGGDLVMMAMMSDRNYRVMEEVFHNTFKLYKFMEEYSCLLQEYISPEDYDEAMKSFHERTAPYARASRKLSDEEIAYDAKLVLSITGGELGSDELADILNVHVFDVDRALRKYSKCKAVLDQ